MRFIHIVIEVNRTVYNLDVTNNKKNILNLWRKVSHRRKKQGSIDSHLKINVTVYTLQHQSKQSYLLIIIESYQVFLDSFSFESHGSLCKQKA